MTKVIATCISERKGTVKKEVPTIHCIEDYGIEHDAHAGKWHRQVSLMSLQDMKDFQSEYPTQEYGAYAENILIDDYRLRYLPIGSRIKINDVILEVTQIGKECHNGCAIQKRTGQCIMPQIGIFTKVIQGGFISPQDEVFFEVPDMYQRQSSLISSSQQNQITKQHVVIVGIGALGQTLSESLVRMGYQHITLIDFDNMTYSNFNRQRYANLETIGQSKVTTTKTELLKINPSCHIETYNIYLKEKNQIDCINEKSILVDCTDNIQSKIDLEKLATQNNIPLVHGGIDGWYGQVITIFPQEYILKKLFQNKEDKPSSSIVITAQIIASLQAKAVLKLTLGQEEDLKKQLTLVDLLNHDIRTIEIKD